jgi:FkbM family methyltransferase
MALASAHINGLSRIVIAINKAVSDHPGTAQFGFSFSEIGGGSLAKGARGAHVGSKDQYIEVPLVRIDDVLPADLIVDCAKLDVEGHELAALRGMRKIIERSPNIQLVLEFFPVLHGRSQGAGEVLTVPRQGRTCLGRQPRYRHYPRQDKNVRA